MTGDLGLPLIGTGDWNDGMNRVGEAGRGESVWLGWLLLRTIAIFSALAEGRDPSASTAGASTWRECGRRSSGGVGRSVVQARYLRRRDVARIDLERECRIDSIAQSWAVLSGAARPERAAQAMASLVCGTRSPDEGLALLFTPPFDRTPHDPGYIKGYPPGLRENGASTAMPRCGPCLPTRNSATVRRPMRSSLSSTDQPCAEPRGCRTVQSRALCRRRGRLFGTSPCGTRWLDLVHGFRRMDVPGRD